MPRTAPKEPPVALALPRFVPPFLALLGGALVTLSLAPFDLWPLGILSTALYAWLLLQTRSARQAGWLGWYYGVGLFGTGTSWVYVSIHVYGYAPAPLAGALTALFCLALGLFTALPAYIYARWLRDTPIGRSYGFAAVFVLGEWWRSWFLTGFPWLYLGYAHLDTPLAGWAPVGGVLLISLIVAFSGAVLGSLCEQYRQQGWHSRALWAHHHTAITLLLTLWLGGALLQSVSWTQPSAAPLQVAMIQANISQHEKWQAANYQTTLKLYRQMSEPLWGSYDVVIWPEAAIPAFYQRAQGFLGEMEQRALADQATLITGIPYYNREREQSHNSIIALGQGSGLYHKQRLVPFGEYVPLEGLLRGLIQFFDLPMSAFSPGDSEQAALKVGDVSLAPFICYEVVYPDLVSRWLPQAELLLTISNDAWFGGSIGPLQHLQMAQMRALETGRYMIRATGSGVSAIINPRGQLEARSQQFQQQILTGTVTPLQGATPFALTGQWPLLIVCALLCVAGPIAVRMRR